MSYRGVIMELERPRRLVARQKRRLQNSEGKSFPWRGNLFLSRRQTALHK